MTMVRRRTGRDEDDEEGNNVRKSISSGVRGRSGGGCDTDGADTAAMIYIFI